MKFHFKYENNIQRLICITKHFQVQQPSKLFTAATAIDMLKQRSQFLDKLWEKVAKHLCGVHCGGFLHLFIEPHE